MRRSTHVAAGVIAAGGVELIRCWVNQEEVDWLKVAAACAIGGCVAVVPDLLEPALHPNHRSLFHSVAAGGTVVYGLGKKTASAVPDPWVRLALQSLAVGYLSHLALDATTPKSLPLLGCKRSCPEVGR
ncbi:metal-dependent hydrolase [candidate division WOR-3 bacterium]|nr:metal-dependent hydrolase [candidate division WOR-3 bacterium]